MEPPLRGNPPGSQDLCGGSSTTTSPVYSKLSDPLDLTANCLTASDLDLVFEVEVGSDFGGSSERELNEVCPPPSNFKDVICNPSMRVSYRELVPLIRLFSTLFPISKGDWRHLTDFMQGWDIPLDLHPNCENFKRTEGDTSSKDYNCLVEAFYQQGIYPQSHLCSPFPYRAPLPLGQAWWLPPTSLLFSELGSIQEAPWHCPWCWSRNVLWTWGFRGQLVLISAHIGSING